LSAIHIPGALMQETCHTNYLLTH
jgi:hypothetical protein